MTLLRSIWKKILNALLEGLEGETMRLRERREKLKMGTWPVNGERMKAMWTLEREGKWAWRDEKRVCMRSKKRESEIGLEVLESMSAGTTEKGEKRWDECCGRFFGRGEGGEGNFIVE